MKKCFVIFICFLSTLSFAQNKLAQTAINELNKQLKIYETLSAHGGLYSFIDLKLSKADIKEFDNTDDVINDSLQDYSAILIIQDKILTLINTVFILKSINEFDLTDKLYQNIGYHKSDDNKLHNLVLHAKSGGSYQSRLSVIYFKENNNYLKIFETYQDEGDGNLFHEDGYDSIITITTPTHVKYLLQGSVKTCGMCFYSYILLIHLENDVFEVDFSYTTDSRSYDTELEYDESKQTISVSYETDDLSGPDCFCVDNSDDDDNDYESSDDDKIIEKRCTCLFVFNGETFVLKSENSKIIKN